MITRSDKHVRQFYKDLGGPRGMLALEREYARPDKIVPVVEKLLGKPKKRVLDLCCGYGRIGVPRSLRGYEVRGVDFRSDMIRHGRLLAKRMKAPMTFRKGDMRNLAYDSETYDAVICLWNSFNHLLSRREQVRVDLPSNCGHLV